MSKESTPAVDESVTLKKDIKSLNMDVPEDVYDKIDKQLELEKSQEKISPSVLSKELFSVAPELKGKMTLSIILSCIGEIFCFASYFFGAYAASWLLRFHDGEDVVFSNIIKYGGIALGGLVLHLLLTGISGATSHRVAFSILSRLRIRLFDKLKEIPLGYMVENPIGKIKVVIQYRVGDLEDWVAHLMPELPGRVLHPLLATVVLFVLD